VSEAKVPPCVEHSTTPGAPTERRRRVALGLAQAAVFVLAAALRFWRLDQNGYDNEYYAAAVRTMGSGVHNFLYNSFDPAGFVSVDKPPVALWIQVASVKLFGFHGLSILLPQVLEGVASVWLVYHLVQRFFGAPAGLLAALFMALTPVSVAVDRSGNTESCLVLVLLLAAWALLRAVEEGKRRHLLLAMALIGLGFNVKMLAAFVVLPTFALVYFVGAPADWRRRIADLALGAVVLMAVSLPWMVAYDLTPSAQRPFVGSSTQNSMLELAIGHNGVGRFVRLAGALRPGGSDRPAGPPSPVSSNRPAGPVWPRSSDPGADRPGEVARAAGAETSGASRPPSGFARLFVRTRVGPLRLADGQLAGQVAWLFPLALMGLVAGALRGRFRRPLVPAHLAIILWSGWVITYAAVYSYAGGIFHFYYLATLAPPLAALAGIGAVWLWDAYTERGWRSLLLPGALVLTATWQVYVEADGLGWKAGQSPGLTDIVFPAGSDWRTWLHGALLVGTLAAAGCLLAVLLTEGRGRVARGLSFVALSIGLVALLVIPTAWALSSVLIKGIAVLPSADPLRLSPEVLVADARRQARSAASANTARLVEFLQGQRQGERYLLATSSTRLAAPIIIETGEPVMAMGGFHGLDPILTPSSVAHLVETNQLRYVMLGDLSVVSRRLGGEVALRPVADWVRANGTLVDPALWRPDGRRLAGRTSELQLYDLRPSTETRTVPAPTPAASRGPRSPR